MKLINNFDMDPKYHIKKQGAEIALTSLKIICTHSTAGIKQQSNL